MDNYDKLLNILITYKYLKDRMPEWVYLIHHMHVPKKASDMETLHHCVLFGERNLGGEKYQQYHLLHAIQVDDTDNPPKVVYDHLNNKFKIIKKIINNKIHYIITKPIKIIAWSGDDN